MMRVATWVSRLAIRQEGGSGVPVSKPVRLIGHSSVLAVLAIGQVTCLLGQSLRALWRDRPRWTVLIEQMYSIGYRSLPVVLLTGLSTGLVLAVQAYYTLSTFRGETVTGAMVNYALVSQLAPVLVGLMLAGRVGSAIAAEIGAMKVTEQLDALRVMGVDPISYLVVPRVCACVLLLPALTAVGALAGVWAAERLALDVWAIDPAAYRAQIDHFVDPWEVVTGLLKTLVFGAIIALVACRKGLRTEGGSAAVGTACTEGVVGASLLILLSNFVLTLMLQRLQQLVL